ncbi:hypothetical protein CORC01_08350 [Colletotrichum orchidophilum]|uniref:Uncharacterized protein n=1 Tax=Colletotrichum orchidophilum TaxID=1209926 RepID=A0A1G4B4B2_9PEZI|nr:uncharacterized protein CORC01_08350 [Colletotrichum orchidophilum]OHE96278.1 hypothetical protein CORC01_08350 [Colletotrichum orchidophilum]
MDQTYPELSWNQTSPGTWQRSIDEVEEFYSAMPVLYGGSGLMFFAITGHVSLTFDITGISDLSDASRRVDQALKNAWLTLRYDHPTIASQVNRDLATGKWTKTYRYFKDKADQQSWIDKTLVHTSSGQTGVQWANSQPPAPKVPTLFVLSPLSDGAGVIRRDLVLRSPHDIIDGIGTLTLINNLIARASTAFSSGDAYILPTFDGSEAANLSPPYRIAANVPPTLTDAQNQRLADMAAQKSAAMNAPAGIEIIDMPYRRGKLVPGRHQRVAVTLTREQTARLTAACKSADATVTHAFHAAIALVMRDLQPRQKRGPEPKRVRYVNYILRNERASCQPPYNSAKHPAALYHSVPGQSLVVDMDLPTAGDDARPPREDEFLPVVQLMKDFYHGVKDDKEHYALAPTIWAAGNPVVPISPEHLPVPPPKEHPSVSISSMGRVDGIISPKTGAIEAYDPWVTGEELGNGLGLFLGTFRGELCLSAAFNDAWHTEADVLDFLKRCETVVFRGLGLSSD